MAFTVAKAFDLISAAHERGRLAHAFLVTGAKGSGKEELAAKMAHLLNGKQDEGDDLWGEPVEVEAPSLDDQEGEYIRVVRPRSKSRQIAVDDIRALEKMMNQSSPEGTWKIGVIVDADRMGDSAANAFLKTLEEPPRESILLLLSSEPEKLLATIWSRCVHLSLAATPGAERPEQVQRILPLLESVTREGIGELETGLAIKAGLENLLRDRKKMYLAQASADYLGERALMIETIHAWVGDLLRLKAGGEGLEFPEYMEVMGKAVEDEDLDVLLRRVAAMEELRRLLETNVVEALALEVSLMNTFGKITA
jgi:DNA polymerase-3 subunit delta'